MNIPERKTIQWLLSLLAVLVPNLPCLGQRAGELDEYRPYPLLVDYTLRQSASVRTGLWKLSFLNSHANFFRTFYTIKINSFPKEGRNP